MTAAQTRRDINLYHYYKRMNFIVFTFFLTMLDKYFAAEGFIEGSNALIRCIVRIVIEK